MTQPFPTPNNGTAIADLVIADIVRRKELGIKKYGIALQAHNGRNSLQDAYEECLDMAQYLRQAIAEQERSQKPTHPDVWAILI